MRDDLMPANLYSYFTCFFIQRPSLCLAKAHLRKEERKKALLLSLLKLVFDLSVKYANCDSLQITTLKDTPDAMKKLALAGSVRTVTSRSLVVIHSRNTSASVIKIKSIILPPMIKVLIDQRKMDVCINRITIVIMALSSSLIRLIHRSLLTSLVPVAQRTKPNPALFFQNGISQTQWQLVRSCVLYKISRLTNNKYLHIPKFFINFHILYFPRILI